VDDVWSAPECTPADIEEALRALLAKRTEQTQGYTPARVLNLVVIVDKEWRGEIANRLEQVGRYHASRTVMCVVEQGRESLSATARMTAPDQDPPPGHVATGEETIEIDVGPQHLGHLDSIVDPILVSELMTVVWSPHGHPEAVDGLMRLTQVVLLDSLEEPEVHAALERGGQLAAKAYVVDLSWLRSVPWRERIASTFDAADMRPELAKISALTVRYRSDSLAAGVLFVGWMASRLGWRPSPLVSADGGLRGQVHARRQDVDIRLDADQTMPVPGLAGMDIETASGLSMSLDRDLGGLRARRRERDGEERTWHVLGASRGEGGILGEGVRQALLRDPTFQPALEAARGMVR